MKHRIISLSISGFRALVRTVFVALTLTGASQWLAPPLNAAERHWTGSASGLWSNPNNWNPVGVPEPGDQVTFDSGGDAVFNDLVGVTVDRIWFLSGTWQ